MRNLKFIVLVLCLWTCSLFSEEVNRPVIVAIRASNGEHASPAVERHSLGFIVEEEGFLLTTYEGLTFPQNGTLLPLLEVTLSSSSGMESYRAHVIGVEPTLNFAVLKIDREGGFPASQILRDRSLVTGDEIFAASRAKAVAPRIVAGHLLSLNSKECYQESLTATMFAAEIDIPASGIGGPVFDRAGLVLGMFTGYHPPEDEGEHTSDDAELTHILPIFLAFNIYDSIKQRQSLASPWTGFSVRPLNVEEEQQFPVAHGKFTAGIAFEYIWENSPAEAMDLRVDDILLRFAYYPIHSPADFQKWLYMYGVGRTVKLFILRDGAILEKEYTIEERPDWADPI